MAEIGKLIDNRVRRQFSERFNRDNRLSRSLFFAVAVVDAVVDKELATIMAKRTSTATQFSVRLGHDAIDHNGIALQHDIIVSPNDDSTIAPWIDEAVSARALK